MANVAIWSSESLWNDGVATKEASTSVGPATMQHPATILRKWCESENLMETSLSIPLLGLAPASTPVCDARYKLCTLAVAFGRFSSPARLGERAHDRLVE